MITCEYHLRFLKAGVDQLESYLLSNDIYRPVGVRAPAGDTPYPQLTLGWLLLFRLQARLTCLTGEPKNEIERLSQELDAKRSQWRTAWGAKAQAEFHARLNLWRDFLEEYRKNPAENYKRYSYEVSRRVLLHLLGQEAGDLPETDLEMLSALDQALKTGFIPADFIWDDKIASGFPKSTYWYLYGSLERRLESS